MSILLQVIYLAFGALRLFFFVCVIGAVAGLRVTRES